MFDDARLLAKPEADAIEQRLARLETEPRRRLVVVTATSLHGRPIEAVAETLGNRSGMAAGVILLVAPNERKIRIAVGNGSRGLVSDAEAHKIIDRVMLPDLRKNRFGPAIIKGVDRIAAELSETMV